VSERGRTGVAADTLGIANLIELIKIRVLREKADTLGVAADTFAIPLRHPLFRLFTYSSNKNRRFFFFATPRVDFLTEMI